MLSERSFSKGFNLKDPFRRLLLEGFQFEDTVQRIARRSLLVKTSRISIRYPFEARFSRRSSDFELFGSNAFSEDFLFAFSSENGDALVRTLSLAGLRCNTVTQTGAYVLHPADSSECSSLRNLKLKISNLELNKKCLSLAGLRKGAFPQLSGSLSGRN